MENNIKSKTTSKNSNIPKGEIGIKIKNDYSKLIPLHISAAKQAYFLPENNKKNTIYINDLETLNESSFTNNLEGLSNRDMQSFGDSMSLVHSRQGSKTDLLEDKYKKINLHKYQDEFIKKEKEIILLKKEINELQNNNNKLKEQESLNQTLFLKLNENYNNLEQLLNNIKKEFSVKEKELLQQIEQLKNDIKDKDIFINTLQEQSNYNKNIIDNLNKVIKEKDVKINALKKTIKKNQKYLKSNVDINITNNINSNNNCTFSNTNKDNDNYKNTKTNKNHANHNKVNLKEFMRKYNLNNKNQNLSNNTDSKNKKKLQNQNKNEFTYHDQGPPKQIKNYNYIEESIASIPKKSGKDSSLKKQLQLSNKVIKNKKGRSKNNVCYSLKSLSNLQLERNGLNKYSNTSHSSFTNKMKDFDQTTFNRKKMTYNYSNNNLTKDKKSKDFFLKRLYKYNKRIIKTSISESTNSYLYSDNDNSNNYYNQKINNDKNFDFLKKNSTANNILREHFYRSSLKNIFSMSKKSRKSIEDTPQNRRKLNNQINDYENKKNINDSFSNDLFSDNEKIFNYIKGQYKFKKPNFLFNNSMIDNMNFTSNKNSHSLKLSVRNTKARDNHIL